MPGIDAAEGYFGIFNCPTALTRKSACSVYEGWNSASLLPAAVETWTSHFLVDVSQVAPVTEVLKRK